MASVLRHYVWNDLSDGKHGRIAVSAECDRFVLKRLAGKAPPPAVLLAVWADLGPEFGERCGHYARTRKNPYIVQTRTGMSGCMDVLVRELRNLALRDMPIIGGLHISMTDKLNEDVSLWLGDIPAIWDELRDMYDVDDVHIYEVPLPRVEDWNWRVARDGEIREYDIRGDADYPSLQGFNRPDGGTHAQKD